LSSYVTGATTLSITTLSKITFSIYGFRYYFGIIDIFTEYGFRQKISRILKTLKYFSTDHSSAPPEVYSQRLLRFVETRVADESVFQDNGGEETTRSRAIDINIL
jgi:Phosphatidylinositol-4-phosphate 5-Kinase